MNRLSSTFKTIWPWLKTLALIALIFWAVNAWRTRETPHQSPNFSAPMLNGQTFDLKHFQQQHPNQAIALIFWAEWCPICRTEEHSINRLVNDPKIIVIPVATQSGAADAVKHRVLVPAFGVDTEIAEGEALLDVLERAGVPIIGACRTGVCGSCKCKVEGGTVNTASTAPLTPEEVAGGVVLACSSTVSGEVSVSLV